MIAIQKEANEVEIASHFLRDIGHADAHVISLREFADKNLRNKSPDVVATLDNKLIGIELTAYSYNDSRNRLSSTMERISMIASQQASNYPQLSGVGISYRPRLTNEPRGRDAKLFVEQILDFAISKLGNSPLTLGEVRRFPKYGDPFDQIPFANWTLVEKHVSSVTLSRISTRESYPVGVSRGGLVNHTSLDVDLIVDIINKKADIRRQNCFTELDENWLLIHAKGWPISSRIIPIGPGSGADEKLREPRLMDVAQVSGFDQVYVWDGVHHGFAELTGKADNVE